MIKCRANGRSEDQVVILPQRFGQQPVLGLAAELLMERLAAGRKPPGERIEGLLNFLNFLNFPGDMSFGSFGYP
jgi:hypothetical protein